MSTGSNNKKAHPWRTYGSPISKQWGNSHETPKPSPVHPLNEPKCKSK